MTKSLQISCIIFEKLATGDFPTLYLALLEEMESFTGLQENFPEEQLPKMS